MGLKVQHSELPDNLLHEPKGASTASENTVYVANGSGSGEFKKIDLGIVEFTRGDVDDIIPTDISDSIVIDASGLLQISNGMMTDIPYGTSLTISETDIINKNFRELYEHSQNTNTIVTELKTSIDNLNDKINELITILKTAGVVNNG